MKRRSISFYLFVLGPLALFFIPSAFADTILTIDEFTGSCNTTTGCTASLPFAPVTGQLDLSNSSSVLDVVTFNNSSSSYTFASDNIAGFDAPADTSLPPTPLANIVTLPEPIGPKLVVYTPTAGQPGYALDNSGKPLTYNVYDDGAGPVGTPVPEPSMLAFLLAGIVVAGSLAGTRRLGLLA